jgi:hypothetical protein
MQNMETQDLYLQVHTDKYETIAITRVKSSTKLSDIVDKSDRFGIRMKITEREGAKEYCVISLRSGEYVRELKDILAKL